MILGHSSELVQSLMQMLNLDPRKVVGFTLRCFSEAAVTVEVLEYVSEPTDSTFCRKRFKLVFEEIIKEKGTENDL